MASLPFISERKYIKWGETFPAENTSTLVLTTRDKFFVDIRIYQPFQNIGTPSSSDNIEWAFAGTSISTPATYHPDGTIANPAHSEWTHWIDSKTTSEVRDDGYMYPQSDGSVLEKGNMVNPATGRPEDYEEVWLDLEPGYVGKERVYKSWVLKAEGDEGEKGMIARVGEYIQAVVRKQPGVNCARWKWTQAKGWETEFGVGFGMGETVVPHEVFEEREFKLGDSFIGKDGLKWKCVESMEWT